MSERAGAGEVANITGKTVRAIQGMASRGQIPGAAKIGGTWTFDISKIRAWIRAQEAQVCQEKVATETVSNFVL